MERLESYGRGSAEEIETEAAVAIWEGVWGLIGTEDYYTISFLNGEYALGSMAATSLLTTNAEVLS